MSLTSSYFLYPQQRTPDWENILHWDLQWNNMAIPFLDFPSLFTALNALSFLGKWSIWLKHTEGLGRIWISYCEGVRHRHHGSHMRMQMTHNTLSTPKEKKHPAIVRSADWALNIERYLVITINENKIKMTVKKPCLTPHQDFLFRKINVPSRKPN